MDKPLRPLHSPRDLLPRCRNGGASLGHATNVGGKRSSVMESSLVPIVLYIAMVREHYREGDGLAHTDKLDCTYDQPSNRRRNPAPQYIEALETRLQRAEALLRTLLPNVDINDPNIEAAVQQRRQEGNAEKLVQRAGDSTTQDKSNTTQNDAQLRSMIESTGQLDLDESGRWDFHGGSSGTVFVKRMREQFGGLLGGGYGTPFLPRLPRTAPLGPIYDSPRSATESPYETGLPNTLDLPSRETARALCTMSLECACALLRFVHQPSFYEMFDRIYDLPPEQYGDEENRFLPLLYVLLALGCMFHSRPTELEEEPAIPNYKVGIESGYGLLFP
jgi:hypothetical protein